MGEPNALHIIAMIEIILRSAEAKSRKETPNSALTTKGSSIAIAITQERVKAPNMKQKAVRILALPFFLKKIRRQSNAREEKKRTNITPPIQVKIEPCNGGSQMLFNEVSIFSFYSKKGINSNCLISFS
jgi:hypothetical protein